MDTPYSLANVRRSWLERVLDVVRRLGGCADLTETLELITAAVVDVLDFGAAAVNVVTADGRMRTAAVAGPPDLEELVGQIRPLQPYVDLLEASEEWGSLRYYSHDRDPTKFQDAILWTPPGQAPDDPEAWHPEDALMAPLWDRDGSLIGVLGVDQPRSGRRPDAEQLTILELFAHQAARAIGESAGRRHAEARQREAELRWKLAFERSPIGAAIVGRDGSLALVNDSLAAMLGCSREQLERMTFADITHPDDIDSDTALFSELIAGQRESYELEKRYLRADGRVMWGVLHVGVIRDETGAVESVVGQVNDITARKHAEEQLAHRLTHDPLTDLPNRAALEQQLATHLGAARPAGVLACDVDRFRTINDSLGHDIGDEVLVAVARRLRAAVPARGTVGRIGGDQFVVLAPGADDPARLQALAARIMSALAEPLTVRGRTHAITVSIGATVTGAWHDHPNQVLRQADQALLRAKRHGRARVEIYDPTRDRLATVEDLELEQALRTAIASGEGLTPYLQPIVSIADNHPVGYESLVRWQHPSRGLLGPQAFLPVAEQTGLIVPLGWWMLDVACRAAVRPSVVDGWTRWVAVNASGSQLGRGQLVPAVRAALAASGLPPQRLHVEITETALADASPAAVKEVHEVADLGVHIALDDFGTGYSSLSLLRDLPVSAVKIDRSFVTPIAVDHTAIAIVRSVIGLCRELGITTVAEGVETEEQLTALRALGCSQAQGYLIGRPAPVPPVTAD